MNFRGDLILSTYMKNGLASALIGHEQLLDLYTPAVRENDRFNSYGDAILIY